MQWHKYPKATKIPASDQVYAPESTSVLSLHLSSVSSSTQGISPKLMRVFSNNIAISHPDSMQPSACLAHTIFIHVFCLSLSLRTVLGSHHMPYPSLPTWPLFYGFALIISCIILPSRLILCRVCPQWHCCFTWPYKHHSWYCMGFWSNFALHHFCSVLSRREEQKVTTAQRLKKIRRKLNLVIVLKTTCRSRAQSTLENLLGFF